MGWDGWPLTFLPNLSISMKRENTLPFDHRHFDLDLFFHFTDNICMYNISNLNLPANEMSILHVQASGLKWFRSVIFQITKLADHPWHLEGVCVMHVVQPCMQVHEPSPCQGWSEEVWIECNLVSTLTSSVRLFWSLETIYLEVN